ncbi:uncharacterized protein LOC119097335 [Pollicipes pollicipes]|uniref:uncharacterized protein LOC119097335 n=1 Tax=Pollicipes pollicipes TaxID=41117 RepID=UPI001884E214|nr:uncharacterized protein LOC119097335 [Pollicipes pollicipes]
MQPVELYGWVAAAAAAPLQVTLAVGVLTLLHACRGRWRTVDLFLVAVLAQQLLAAVLALGFALLRLMRPDAAAACAAFAWAWTALRTLQASTVASMAADRVLTAQWPYKYRYFVALVTVLCYALNHLPYLVSTTATPYGPNGESEGRA